MAAASPLRIVLNVGGVRFETTRQTIEKSLMLIGLVDTVRAGNQPNPPLRHPETCARMPARHRVRTSLNLVACLNSSWIGTRHSLARSCG
jgi:hypothetical protein